MLAKLTPADRAESTKPRKERFVHWFDELKNSDVGLVGGKNASLGEMYQELQSKGMTL